MKQFQQEKNWIRLANIAYKFMKDSQFFLGRVPSTEMNSFSMEKFSHYLVVTFK